MRYDEFKQKVERLSSRYRVTKTYNTIYLEYDGGAVGFIEDKMQFKFKNNFNESMPFSHKLYMLTAEYAMTPVGERTDEKLYVFPIWIDYAGDRYFIDHLFNSATSNINHALHADQEKIDAINRLFTFNLNDIKQEVSDD